jgi:YD repeat-containing protein
MTIEFDAVQRITAQRDPEGHYISRTYDENGNLSRVDRHELVRDPLTGAVAREDVFSSLQEFDDLDRRKRLMDGLGNVIRYDYDSEGRVEIVTDPSATSGDPGSMSGAERSATPSR